MPPYEAAFDDEDLAVDIHLRDGSVISTFVTDADCGEDATDTYLEKTVAGAARWVWIGQAYVFNRAISGIAYVDRDDIAIPA